MFHVQIYPKTHRFKTPVTCNDFPWPKKSHSQDAQGTWHFSGRELFQKTQPRSCSSHSLLGRNTVPTRFTAAEWKLSLSEKNDRCETDNQKGTTTAYFFFFRKGLRLGRKKLPSCIFLVSKNGSIIDMQMGLNIVFLIESSSKYVYIYISDISYIYIRIL